MVNENRIVPIQKIDYLSMIGTILTLHGTSFDVLAAEDGAFTVEGTGDAGNILCNEPAKTIDFADGVTAGTVYFCADFAFEGITIAGTAQDVSEIKKDGVTLYKAVLAEGAVTVTAITPEI